MGRGAARGNGLGAASSVDIPSPRTGRGGIVGGAARGNGRGGNSRVGGIPIPRTGRGGIGRSAARGNGRGAASSVDVSGIGRGAVRGDGRVARSGSGRVAGWRGSWAIICGLSSTGVAEVPQAPRRPSCPRSPRLVHHVGLARAMAKALTSCSLDGKEGDCANFVLTRWCWLCARSKRWQWP